MYYSKLEIKLFIKNLPIVRIILIDITFEHLPYCPSHIGGSCLSSTMKNECIILKVQTDNQQIGIAEAGMEKYVMKENPLSQIKMDYQPQCFRRWW